MDVLSLEDDDMGLFITQTPNINANVENLAALCDNFGEFSSSQMDEVDGVSSESMHYSDISDVEEEASKVEMHVDKPNFEWVSH